MLSFLTHAHAQEPDFKNFAQIPVQHEGRIKPIDTFARSILYTISGKSSLGAMDADEWLAETLFDPAQALHRPLFRVLKPQTFDLPARKSSIYSFAEISPVLLARSTSIQTLLSGNEETWSEDQRELLRLHEISILYTQLLRSFSFVLPLNISLPESLAKEWGITEEKPFTLADFQRFETRLDARVKKIINEKGDQPDQYSPEEQQIALFAMDMQILKNSGENNILFRIVPAQWEFAKGEWYSPWALTQQGAGSPSSAEYLGLWKEMAHAYTQRDSDSWNEATSKALKTSHAFSSPEKLKVEFAYNKFHPLTIAMMFYALALAGYAAFALRTCRNSRYLACAALLGGCVLHGASILARVLILERPPVGTLYESILFVALTCSVIGLIYEMFRKDGNGLLIGALSGLLLLFTAQGFGGDDTMKMLVAVLNTNFWLSTHVLCITLGYGWCIITSLLAHTWLARTALGKDAGNLMRGLKTLTLLSLLFTAIGTLLGGIWADQSWGRFWGWDPKENGALLIVLWLIWVLHAQITGHLDRTKWVAALAGLSIIVGLAWFGVNLLGTGLHSYGFITGVAGGLFAFCAAEVLLIGALVYKISTRSAA